MGSSSLKWGGMYMSRMQICVPEDLKAMEKLCKAVTSAKGKMSSKPAVKAKAKAKAKSKAKAKAKAKVIATINKKKVEEKAEEPEEEEGGEEEEAEEDPEEEEPVVLKRPAAKTKAKGNSAAAKKAAAKTAAAPGPEEVTRSRKPLLQEPEIDTPPSTSRESKESQKFDEPAMGGKRLETEFEIPTLPPKRVRRSDTMPDSQGDSQW